MRVPRIPDAVSWRNGMVLEPVHFTRTDERNARLFHVAGLVADPWPWGFLEVRVDETALASSQLRLSCHGIFPDGRPFRQRDLVHDLQPAQSGGHLDFQISRDSGNGALKLEVGDDAPSESTLPAARLVFHGGVWERLGDWSPPALLIDPDHPMRLELNRQLGALAALGSGFMATLRLPGAEERPVARVLGQVAAALAQGTGVMDALLSSPAVSPGRLGVEALRLALGVRSAAGIFEPLRAAWDPKDQRGSIRRILYAAETAASGIGLPFRASVFQDTEQSGVLCVDGMPPEALLLAIEASRPADLIAARSWIEGAALAAPDRIEDALNRRVAGCTRRPVERDPRIGVSSGPLLALYQIENDVAWRGGTARLALASRMPPPANTSFSVLLPEAVGAADSGPQTAGLAGPLRAGGHWAGSIGDGGSR